MEVVGYFMVGVVKKGWVGDKIGLSKMLRWWVGVGRVCRVLCEGGGGWRCSCGEGGCFECDWCVLEGACTPKPEQPAEWW